MDIVSFETAKKLKDAGFPQPELEYGKFWYDDFEQIIGKRILAKVSRQGTYNSSVVEEIKIIEVSPSENWVKVQNMNGGKYWVPISGIAFVEVLKSLKDGKPLD